METADYSTVELFMFYSEIIIIIIIIIIIVYVFTFKTFKKKKIGHVFGEDYLKGKDCVYILPR